jgi:peptidoglycan/LPS O-acetylase OafA/YrhL
MSQARIPELDGLRGLAILLVLIWHYLVAAAQVPPATTASYVLALGRLTWSGVDLFFVLSGFLIGGILLDNRDSSTYFKTFYVRRLYRILPMYFLLLSVCFTFQHLQSGSQFGHLFPWFAYLTFTQNLWMAVTGTLGAPFLAVTWSLAIEEQFYLSLPFLIRYVKSRRLPYLIAVLILLAPALRLLFYFTWPHAQMAPFALMPCRADSLLLGVGAACLVRSRHAWLATNGYVLLPALMLLGCGVLYLTKISMQFNSLLLNSIGYTWIALFYVCVLLLVISHQLSFFRNPLFIWLGSVAYGVYLLHQAVAGTLFHGLARSEPQLSNLRDFGIASLSLVVTLILAAISWTYFEKPMVKRGQRWNYELATGPMSDSGVESLTLN